MRKINYFFIISLINYYVFCIVAPDQYIVEFQTTVTEGDGKFILNITREFAPHAADRFFQLVELLPSYYNDNAFFHVTENEVSFGINGNPATSGKWKDSTFTSDRVNISNTRSTVVFYHNGVDTSSTRLFINKKDNPALDSLGFAPLGYVLTGMNIIDAINNEYSEEPQIDLLYKIGNPYLHNDFPNLDYINEVNLIHQLSSGTTTIILISVAVVLLVLLGIGVPLLLKKVKESQKYKEVDQLQQSELQEFPNQEEEEQQQDSQSEGSD